MVVPSSTRSCYDARFDSAHLLEMFHQFKQNSSEDLLDTHTFISLMVQNY